MLNPISQFTLAKLDIEYWIEYLSQVEKNPESIRFETDLMESSKAIRYVQDKVGYTKPWYYPHLFKMMS